MTRRTWRDYAPPIVWKIDRERPGFAEQWRRATMHGALAEFYAARWNLWQSITEPLRPIAAAVARALGRVAK